MKISYDSEELIAELKQDILEFGTDKMFLVWIKNICGTEIVTNYDFIIEEKPITSKEINADEKVILMQANLLLEKLIKQNEIF